MTPTKRRTSADRAKALGLAVSQQSGTPATPSQATPSQATPPQERRRISAADRMSALGLSDTPQSVSSGRFFARSQAQEACDLLSHVFDEPITVLHHPFAKSAKSRGSNVDHWRRLPMAVALTLNHPYDGHTNYLSVDTLIREDERSPRVTLDALKLGARIDYLMFDYDLPKASHGGKEQMTPEKFRECILKYTEHPILRGCVFYATRGGLRAVTRLAKPFHLDPSLRGADWSAFYERLRKSLPDEWDPACKDAGRLFRLPWVLRAKYDAKGKIQSTEPQNGELWIPDEIIPYTLTPEDLTQIVASSTKGSERRDAVQGDKLVRFFERISLLGEQYKSINDQPSYYATCPLAHHHSSDNETSTLLHAVEGGGYVLRCLHATCTSIAQERGGWRAYLQSQYATEWREIVGREELDYFYDPYDHQLFVEQVVEILEAQYPDKIFRRHDEIATIERSPHGGARWRAWSVADLCGLVNRVARWSQAGREGETKRTSIPERMIKIHMLAIAEELPRCETATTLPPLDPQTHQPTRFSEGYCPITEAYYLPSPNLDLAKLRDASTRRLTLNDAINAYTDLIDLYYDFPWRHKKHRVLAAAVAMTVALRRSVDVAPLVFVSANNKGAGKTKMLSAASASVHGHTPPLSSLPHREEELKKHLDSLVHSDADFCVFDNVSSRIGGAVLDAFITSPLHSYRPLGNTDIRVSPNRVFLGGTGNNATLGGDTDRRTLMIRLVTELEDPSTRTGFRFPDLIGEAKSRVTRTWCSIITLLRAWREVAQHADQEAVRHKARPFGSFEEWSSLIRDPLMWITSITEGEMIDVVALSREEVDTAQEDNRTELFGILWNWQETRTSKDRSWTSKDLFRDVKRAMEDDDEDSDLASIGESLPRFTLRFLSRLIGSRRDQVSEGLKLGSKKVRGTLTYHLTPVDGAPETPRPKPPETPNVDPFKASSPEPPPQAPRERAEELPVISWSACDIGSAYDVPDRLITARPQYEGLRKRCEFLKGYTCSRTRTDCDYTGADGHADAGISQAVADALVEGMESAIQEIDAPPLIALESLDHPKALEIIAAEFAVRTTQGLISDRLNKENVPPPNGRRWTSQKVGLVARRNQITRPTKTRPTKAETILKEHGHWEGYWPDSHPLVTPSCEGQGRTITQHGHRKADSSAILSALFGSEINCGQAFMRRLDLTEGDDE